MITILLILALAVEIKWSPRVTFIEEQPSVSQPPLLILFYGRKIRNRKIFKF